jgi:predicted transcriptional regulator
MQSYNEAMNEQQLISHIEEIGLSNKEARVYVASLMVGPSAVQRIAEQAGIKRVTTYVILESLVGLGLVSQTVKGKKTYFIAEDPSNLNRLIQKREQELKEQKTNFTQILPELNALKSVPKESPNIRFYDSADGIRTIMNTFLEQARKAGGGEAHDGDEVVRALSNLDQLYVHFPELEQSQVNTARMKAGIHSHFLYASSRGPFLKGGDPNNNRESRWIPIDKFPMGGDFTIVGDNVLMISFVGTHPLGVSITSPEIARGLRAMFDLAWDAAVAYNDIEAA